MELACRRCKKIKRLTTMNGRRRFLRNIATALAAGSASAAVPVAFPMLAPASVLGRDAATPPPSERLAVGVIGCGHGAAVARRLVPFNDVRVIALCDVNETRLESTGNRFDRLYGGTAPVMRWRDYRKMFAHMRLDAVILAVPDHWHGVLSLAAIREGLDVWGEAPLARTIAEGRAIADAAANHGCIWQTGLWRRSMADYRRVARFIRDGGVGLVTHVEVGGGDADTANLFPENADPDAVAPAALAGSTAGSAPHAAGSTAQPAGTAGSAAAALARVCAGGSPFAGAHSAAGNSAGATTGAGSVGKPPATLDYDFWVGPGAWSEYDPLVVAGGWRNHPYYGCGPLGGDAAHFLDIAQWALGESFNGPVSIGGRGEFSEDTPPLSAERHYRGVCAYESGVSLAVSDLFPRGVRFYGERGWLYITDTTGFHADGSLELPQISASDDSILHDFENATGELRVPFPAAGDHWRDFVDCIKTRRATAAPAEVGHRSATIVHLIRAAILTGKRIKWTPGSETIVNDDADASLATTLRPMLRLPWLL
jgi:predicted dehydrogenase